MPSELFDPMLELAIRVAKKGQRAKPPISPPARVAPILKFKKISTKAKEAIYETVDTDAEFRGRVAAAATEAKVGRIGMMFLERPDGWQDFVDTMVDAAEEPVVESTSQIARLEDAVRVAEGSRDAARSDLADADERLRARDEEIERLRGEVKIATDELAKVQKSNDELTAQRQRAVGELKHTEEVMVRHITERKRLEALVATMTAAQLSTTHVGGAVTNAEVCSALDDMEATLSELREQVESLRGSATPEAVAVERRVPLPVPHGLFDTSVEYAEYLFSIPAMTVLIDGYNVTKEADPNKDLDLQREWLLNGLAALAARRDVSFEVVFDGADVAVPNAAGRNGVRCRFTTADVEADDEIIAMVASMDRTKPVTVVSSDKRVRAGANAGGANVLYSRQLIDLL